MRSSRGSSISVEPGPTRKVMPNPGHLGKFSECLEKLLEYLGNFSECLGKYIEKEME